MVRQQDTKQGGLELISHYYSWEFLWVFVVVVVVFAMCLLCVNNAA